MESWVGVNKTMNGSNNNWNRMRVFRRWMITFRTVSRYTNRGSLNMIRTK